MDLQLACNNLYIGRFTISTRRQDLELWLDSVRNCQRNLKRKTMGYGALRNGQKLRSHGHVVSWLWRPPLPPLRLTFLQPLCTFLHTVGGDELPISHTKDSILQPAIQLLLYEFWRGRNWSRRESVEKLVAARLDEEAESEDAARGEEGSDPGCCSERGTRGAGEMAGGSHSSCATKRFLHASRSG